MSYDADTITYDADTRFKQWKEIFLLALEGTGVLTTSAPAAVVDAADQIATQAVKRIGERAAAARG
jgi:hypothetical protein